MEFIYTTALFFFFIAFILLFFKQTASKHSRLPPGPSQLPLIGSIHHLILGSQLPHRCFRDLVASSLGLQDLMHLKFGEVSTIVVSSSEAAKEIMRTHDLAFATRPSFPAIKTFSYEGKSISFGPYGNNWRHLKKICVLEMLSAKRVHSFRHIREEEAHELIQSIRSSDSGIVNLSKMLVQMTNNITFRAVMGKKSDLQDIFMENLNEAIGLTVGFDLTNLFPSLSWIVRLVSSSKSRVERIHQKQDRLLKSIVQAHRERRKTESKAGSQDEEQAEEDFVDMLLRLQEQGDPQFELTDDSIKALILDMFAGGSETTSNILGWAMSELMMNPRVMKRAQAEIRDALRGKSKVTESDIKDLKYLKEVIRETLRLHPPLPLLLPRECRQKCEVMGYEIPAKTRVVVNAWSIGRDPRYWKEAEEFRPERYEDSTVDFKGTDYELLPFGAGRRMCPGMQFGLATLELPFAQLLYYFDWKLPSATKSLDMSEAFGITTHRKFDLLVHANVVHSPPPLL